MEDFFKALKKEKLDFDPESDNKIALAESSIHNFLSRNSLPKADILISKGFLRRIKTSDESIFYLVQKPINKSLATSLIKRKAEPALTKEEEDLEKENKELNALLNGEEQETLYKKYIDLLHDYNEVKDVVQGLIGQVAMVRSTTTKELYPEFDLSEND